MKPNPKAVPRDDLDDGTAFLPDPRKGGATGARDTLAEMMTSEYIESATSAEGQGEDVRDQITTDELGGPFVEVDGDEEFASHDEDGEELESDDKEPFPTAMRSTSR